MVTRILSKAPGPYSLSLFECQTLCGSSWSKKLIELVNQDVKIMFVLAPFSSGKNSGYYDTFSPFNKLSFSEALWFLLLLRSYAEPISTAECLFYAGENVSVKASRMETCRMAGWQDGCSPARTATFQIFFCFSSRTLCELFHASIFRVYNG